MPLPMFEPATEQVFGTPQILAIAAGKGGVGKSTVAACLALALQARGHSVGLLDADVYGPSLLRMLRETVPPEKRQGRLIPSRAGNLKMISMGRFRAEEATAALRAPMATGIISAFATQVEWGALDYLLVDFPPGTGDVQLTLCQQLQFKAAIMVTTPQEVALMDVRKAAKAFLQLGVPIAGVIENMSYLDVAGERVYPFGRGGARRLSGEVGAPFLGAVPLDPEICRACDKGLSEPPENFLSIAQDLLAALNGLDVPFAPLDFLFGKDRTAHWGSGHLLEAIEGGFVIRWPDGTRQEFRFETVQGQCPCALCTARRPAVAEGIKASRVRSVGRYALRLEFDRGCSNGIYSFSLMRRIGRMHDATTLVS